jgi:hypothetical protein
MRFSGSLVVPRPRVRLALSYRMDYASSVAAPAPVGVARETPGVGSDLDAVADAPAAPVAAAAFVRS